MKKLALSLLLLGSLVFKAQDASKVFSSTEIVWFGLDFTKAKFVGQFDQGMGALPATGGDMKNKWVQQWNSLVATEQQNFDFKKALGKDNVFYDISGMNTLNSKMDPDKCMDVNPGKIEKSEIDGMVKKYSSTDKKDGVGLAFVVENFNKGSQVADVYVTFFDIATKKVLICEKISGAAKGIGMRNYWAGAVKSVIKEMGSSFKGWKK